MQHSRRPPPTSLPGVTDDTVTIGTHTPLDRAGRRRLLVDLGRHVRVLRLPQRRTAACNGRAIEYIVKDDGYNPATTQTVVRELVQEDEVFAIVNGLGTPTHTAVLDYLNQNEVPDLFVASGSTSWNQPEKYPYTFGFNADYVVEGAALAQYAADDVPRQEGLPARPGRRLRRRASSRASSSRSARTGSPPSSGTPCRTRTSTAQIGALKAAGCEINVLATINGFTALALGTAAQLGWFPSGSRRRRAPTTRRSSDTSARTSDPKLLQGLVGCELPSCRSASDDEWVSLFREINEEYNDDAPFDGNTIYGMSVAYLFAEALDAAGENPTRESLIEAVLRRRTGRQRHPSALLLRATDHAAYLGVGITSVDQGMQDYVGSTYAVDGGSVVSVEPEPVALAGSGVPGS